MCSGVTNSFTLSAANPYALLVELVQPRDDWFGLQVISSFILDLLPAFDSIERPITGAVAFKEWIRSGAIEELIEAALPKRRGVSGLITEFPINAMLFKLASGSNSLKRLELVALVLSVAAEWRAEMSGSECVSYQNRIQEACRAIRLLSDTAIDWIPACELSVERFSRAFHWKLGGLTELKFGESEVRYLQELGRFFRYFLGEGRVVERASGRNSETHLSHFTGTWHLPMVDEDSEFDRTVEPLVFSSGVSPGEVQQHNLDGNAPAELVSSTLVLDPRNAVAISSGESPKNSIRKSSVKRAGLRRVNRVLPGRWESLNHSELRELFNCLEEAREAYAFETVLILLMLMTGRSAEAVYDCRVVASREQLPDRIEDPNKVYVIPEDHAWACGVLQPEFRRKKRQIWEAHLTPNKNIFLAQFPDRIWILISDIMLSMATRAKKRSVRLFGTNEQLLVPRFEWIFSQSKDLLKVLRRQTGARVTLRRIQSQLFVELAEEASDTVDASMITGAQPPFGQTAALYYQATPGVVLAERYQNVVRSWASLLEDSVSTRRGPELQPDGLLRGSSFVVQKHSLRTATGLIRDQLTIFRKNPLSESVRLFHNLFTAYCQWMLLWGSGFRAVHDPIAKPFEVNERRGLIFIADKTADGNAHHRAVPAPATLIKQLNCYKDHCDSLRGRTFLQNSGVNPQAQFYYIDEKFQLQPATPRILARELERVFPLPLNVSRHTLRSYLRAHSVSGGLVNAFMGHWGIGTEPWSRYSSLDPVLFSEELTPLLSSLLIELGFEKVEGING